MIPRPRPRRPAGLDGGTYGPAELSRPAAAWPGLVVALLTAAAMLFMSCVAWPDMAVSVDVRHGDGGREASAIPRGEAAIVPPLALLAVAPLVATAPALDRRLRRLFQLPASLDPAGDVRALNRLLAGLAILLLAFHAGLLGRYTGMGYPFEQVLPAAAGLLLVLLGLLGLAPPRAGTDGPPASRAPGGVRRSPAPDDRAAGAVLALLGLLTLAAALLRPGTALLLGGVGVAVAVGAARHRRRRA
ncbi:hypothetical protein [Micromonospora sp. CPCC 205561]|uniref:hypothetical protein n=1 Tax=Micromonospora sp. CPCC 205561 TaxID=3122407 RepID=UPI002FEE825C